MSVPLDRPTVVVGGGVVGLNVAYRLAERGAGRILLVEKGEVGDGSSSRSAGIVMGLMYDEPGVVARSRSIDLFEQFDRGLEGYTFHQDGLVRVYDDEGAGIWNERRDIYESAGIRFEELPPDEATARFPGLEVNEDEHVLYDPRGGYSDPDEFVPAMATAVREQGVTIREGERTVDIPIEDGAVSAVVTRTAGGEHRRIEARAVVCTVNAWTNRLLAGAGVELPFKNFVHERFVTRPFDDPPAIPVCADHVREGYLRPTPGGRLLLGTVAHDPGEFEIADRGFDMEAVSPAPAARAHAGRLRQRLSGIADADPVDHRAGLISVTPDTRPIVGPVPGIDGLYLGSNFCSNGFGYAPVAGEILADYVVDGAPSIDVDRWRPDRFAEMDVREFLHETYTHHGISATPGSVSPPDGN